MLLRPAFLDLEHEARTVAVGAGGLYLLHEDRCQPVRFPHTKGVPLSVPFLSPFLNALARVTATRRDAS